MKKLLQRFAFKLLSDSDLMTLYQGVQRGMILLHQQTLRTYWIEQGVVARMSDDEVGPWVERNAKASQDELKRRVALRRLIMESRPELFKGHREDYLKPYDAACPFACRARPTALQFKKIMEQREKAQPGYVRPK